MTDDDIQNFRSVLSAFGAVFEAEPAQPYMEWLVRAGCSKSDARALAMLAPVETILIGTPSFDFGYVFHETDIVAISEGHTDCHLRLIDSGLIAVGNQHSPDLYLLDLADPLDGPCYSLNPYEFPCQTHIERSDAYRLKGNWFRALCDLRRDPVSFLKFVTPRHDKDDCLRARAELRTIFGEHSGI